MKHFPRKKKEQQDLPLLPHSFIQLQLSRFQATRHAARSHTLHVCSLEAVAVSAIAIKTAAVRKRPRCFMSRLAWLVA